MLRADTPFHSKGPGVYSGPAHVSGLFNRTAAWQVIENYIYCDHQATNLEGKGDRALQRPPAKCWAGCPGERRKFFKGIRFPRLSGPNYPWIVRIDKKILKSPNGWQKHAMVLCIEGNGSAVSKARTTPSFTGGTTKPQLCKSHVFRQGDFIKCSRQNPVTPIDRKYTGNCDTVQKRPFQKVRRSVLKNYWTMTFRGGLTGWKKKGYKDYPYPF